MLCAHPLPLLPKRHGFSLIEAAIVLGVVGLVIGGIWAAASHVTQARQTSYMTGAITTALTRVRVLYTGQDISSSTTIDISSNMVKMDIFPSDLIRGSRYIVPWDGALVNIGVQLASNRIVFWIPTPNKSICIRFGSSLFKNSFSSEIAWFYIQTYASTTLWQGVPTSPEDAYTKLQTYCTVGNYLGIAYQK